MPSNFARFVNDLTREVETVEGYLSQREMEFLALLAACPTTVGEILEIGSFKGKSTIILAKAAALATAKPVVNAVDPMTAPSETDPDLCGEASSFADFQRNIEAHGVANRIDLHKMFSHELAASWKKPLRLLWIDGDHTYTGTKNDFDGFARYLADKGIVAFHDVLHEFEGGARVFLEQVLLSPNFGACGFCGSIAWAQFRSDSRETEPHTKLKLSLYKKLARLIPFLVFGTELKGWRKKKYKFFRSRVPRNAIDPQTWLDFVNQ